jgi:hypothetical protein
MLKAVENPNSAELGQGVMVTPEGGYVVAQPDLYVEKLLLSAVHWFTVCTPAPHGNVRFRV